MQKEQLKEIIDTANGLEADIILKGGMLVNVFTGKIVKRNIAIKNNIIAVLLKIITFDIDFD